MQEGLREGEAMTNETDSSLSACMLRLAENVISAAPKDGRESSEAEHLAHEVKRLSGELTALRAARAEAEKRIADALAAYDEHTGFSSPDEVLYGMRLILKGKTR